jgi:hypothetical protein
MQLGSVLVAAAFGVAGCAAPGADAAAEVAVRFAEAVGSDPATACGLLAPRTLEAVEEQSGGGCVRALEDQAAAIEAPGDDPTAVDVAGHSARVVVAGQAVFLSWFDEGWRVTAAGCQRRQVDPQIPYECSVRGS